MEYVLKPCKNCGSTDCHTKRHYNRFGDVWWGVKCYKCGREVVSKLYDEPVDAMYAWDKLVAAMTEKEV